MSVDPNQYSIYGNPEYDGPSISYEVDGIPTELTWKNTVLRTFLVGDGAYDHIEYTDQDGVLKGVLLDYVDGEKIKEELRERSYPIRIDPIIDEATKQWFTELQARMIDRQWAEAIMPPTDTSKN